MVRFRAALVLALVSVSFSAALAQMTLAEAGDEAAGAEAATVQQRPLSTNTGAPPKTAYTNPDLNSDEVPGISKATTTVADWRSRKAPLVSRLVADVVRWREAADDLTRVSDQWTAEGGSGDGALDNAPRLAALEVEMTRLKAQIDAIERTVRADKTAIAALEEEGRRARALPGWFH